MWQRSIGIILVGGLLAACSTEPRMPEPSFDDIDAAGKAAREMQAALKDELMAAMQAGGPEAAIAVCSERAPAIARQVSDQSGYKVSRTALRARNDANAPDAWEAEGLEIFEAALASGASPSVMERSEIVRTEAGGAEFRWMKPILMDEPCTVCHGTQVNEGLQASIASLYPDDEATGFEVGQLRGAFSVRKAVELE